LTPTKTQKLIIPTRTSTQVPSPTTIPFYPTNTPTPTQLPTPTATESEPVVIESCAIDPFTVPVGYNVQITLLVHFSSNIPGYGFNSTFDPNYPQQSGCDGTDDDGDGVAFCLGSSGILPDSTTVHVTFSTSVGNCVASYSSR
jgi:hypothetical protein